ncbi:FAD-dependent thymidylate synthase [Sulfolobus acidocaldarius]|uniref:Flavin-dependent thymidylate synthase n=4 Tax=Sulfolobus acidocaldarius TaxID=2285 RepID=THYX_SULAC|nr:FAD-dependent thymidylate synthase [Sulfolobus acidocaldarius]Q4J6F2.1 RecName: Full=Flavin-dependent thymidylate synthase; Short=FDTS; AltName: Full=FAD-dependent thymidylate synthase; AltName: Full=Thymidylate synthase ThyX; Short=TS; Short=TSase [Sulfolobus acidocaldarius DSM 639]AAY81629.1 thymidylate synthase [Sulfolobus acidocaldarius DSM 639]AGE72232.1 thymidylate synthase, flavin-dependent [Sulfolobus acidocaldarius N8]AGE74549.1 thymidylate synthase, flavin-dependent [Sulfolobus aci
MKIKLVSYSKDGERIVAIAAKMSRSRKGWDYHEKEMTDDEIETWIRDSITHGYWSVLEHSVYTFSIEGISRVASHQLVRHRIASYTQMSHRFAKPVDKYYKPITPPSIEKRGKEVVDKAYQDAYNYFYQLLEKGVPEEDARYVLPNGVNTNIVVTMNARELYNFFGLRLCSRAQWEIRAIAWKMLDEVKRVHPRLFKYAGPNCIIHENFIRENPITLDDIDNTVFISQRCIEGVTREGIPKCVKNARSILVSEDGVVMGK